MPHISESLANIASPDSFSAQYKDPRWKERAARFRRICTGCNSCKRGDVPLYVHHVNYPKDKPIWEVPDSDLVGLCPACHDLIHQCIKDFRAIAARCNASSIAGLTLSLKLMIQKYGERGTQLRLIQADEA